MKLNKPTLADFLETLKVLNKSKSPKYSTLCQAGVEEVMTMINAMTKKEVEKKLETLEKFGFISINRKFHGNPIFIHHQE